MTTANGVVATSQDYDAFGQLVSGSLPRYGFTGREWDDEIKLYYYRARYYDPKIGRFISEDPIQLRGGDVNFYAYVKNNPTNRIDPQGLLFLPPPGVPARTWDFYQQIIQDFHNRRTTGHQRFGGDRNSYMRHCVSSCEAARDYNAWLARLFGFANEAQGILLDIWWIRRRMAGGAMAFQLEDLAANEFGFACAARRCETCEECCTEFGPW